MLTVVMGIIVLVHCVYLVRLGLSVLGSLLPNLVQSGLECKCAFHPRGSLYCSKRLLLRQKAYAMHSSMMTGCCDNNMTHCVLKKSNLPSSVRICGTNVRMFLTGRKSCRPCR